MSRIGDLQCDIDIEDEVAMALYNVYKTRIENDYDWHGLTQACRDNHDSYVKEYGASEPERWAEDRELSSYSECLGTCFSLAPSGKYYTPFANSNVDVKDVILDAAWYDALDDVAESHDMYITSGEGDPCDIFIVLE